MALGTKSVQNIYSKLFIFSFYMGLTRHENEHSVSLELGAIRSGLEPWTYACYPITHSVGPTC